MIKCVVWAVVVGVRYKRIWISNQAINPPRIERIERMFVHSVGLTAPFVSLLWFMAWVQSSVLQFCRATCMHVYAHTHTYIHSMNYIYTEQCITYIQNSMYVYIYIYIYVYVCMYVYIYIYWTAYGATLERSVYVCRICSGVHDSGHRKHTNTYNPHRPQGHTIRAYPSYYILCVQKWMYMFMWKEQFTWKRAVDFSYLCWSLRLLSHDMPQSQQDVYSIGWRQLCRCDFPPIAGQALQQSPLGCIGRRGPAHTVLDM